MIRIKDLKVGLNEDYLDVLVKKINIKKEDIISYEIIRKSVDARKKDNIFYVYTIDINTNKKIKENKNVFKVKKEEYIYNITGKNLMKNRPVIVGSGPAGLFLGYMLSLSGFKPIIIERGEKVEDRVKTVNEFFKTNKLNTNSNVQFGEGGAGTFSDGKLNTLVKDKNLFQKKVFDIFVENGAPAEIKYVNNPHIGTDKLRDVVKNMREKMIRLGAEFRFNSKLTDIIINDNKVEKIIINEKEEIITDNLFLAIGHSARDTFYMLNEKSIKMINKPFAIGIRVMHKQDFINYSQNNNLLKESASYKLTCNIGKRGIYSFCMCPGGYVVNSSSEEGKLTINGMSDYNRDSGVANSAVVVTINEDDYGNNLFDGIKYQRSLEEKTYKLCNGVIPVQEYNDFKNNKVSIKLPFKPMIKGKYELCNLNDLFDKEIKDNLITALEYFNTKIKGFTDEMIIAATEARTSSPDRIIRNENFMSSVKGIYPLGEGAGYAGGITTSAMDGIRVFDSIIKNYKGLI